MGRKIIRLISYMKEFVLILFFWVLGFFCSKMNKKYRDLWLVSERGDDARDNGYWFYKYIKENHPEMNCHFVITKDSADYEKIKKLGGAVEYRSFLHYLMYFSAKYLIGTHVQPCAPDKIMYYHLAVKKVKAKGKQIFLQHGIILNDMEWLNGKNLYIDLFVCGGKPEYEHIHQTYGHKNGVVQYLGLCRFDNLIRSDHRDRMILVMPTWRGSYYPSGDAFFETDYYKSFQSLLSNERLGELLEKYDYKLVFYPHIEMQKYITRFQSKSDRIIIGDKSKYDVQRLLMDCSMLITDYSSVFFDVAYLKKPVLYYQFDEEEFHSYHYKKGYFDFHRDGFGPVALIEEQVISEIEGRLKDNMQLSKVYQERSDRFFELRDDKNCQRIFESICTL